MMEMSALLVYALDWANLLLKWVHVIVAVAWIALIVKAVRDERRSVLVDGEREEALVG